MADPVSWIVGGALLIGGAIAGAVATSEANEAAQDAADAQSEAMQTQADIAALEAQAVRKAGEAEIEARTERFEDIQESARNVYGYAGVELGEGSPLKTLQKSKTRFDKDIANIREMMELGVQKWETAEEGYLAQIPLIQSAAEHQQTANWWSFGGGVLGTGGSLFF